MYKKVKLLVLQDIVFAISKKVEPSDVDKVVLDSCWKEIKRRNAIAINFNAQSKGDRS